MLVSSCKHISRHQIELIELDRFGGQVSEALLKRFESDHGYVAFPETIETCKSCVLSLTNSVVKELKAVGVKTGVVSNADPRICMSRPANQLTR